MRIFSTSLALATLLPAALAAQARYSASFGVTAGTRLVRDQIFQTIDVTQALASTVTLGASLPVSLRERAGLEVSLGFGQTRIAETGLPTVDGPSFRTLSIVGGVDGPLIGPLTYHGGAGIMKYLPDKDGIFRLGGPTLLLLSGGINYRMITRGAIGLVAKLRYDYQRFSTNELTATGFTRTQDVHRVGLGLGIEYQRP
jgi:opacity protein-like surface antigen